MRPMTGPAIRVTARAGHRPGPMSDPPLLGVSVDAPGVVNKGRSPGSCPRRPGQLSSAYGRCAPTSRGGMTLGFLPGRVGQSAQKIWFWTVRRRLSVKEDFPAAVGPGLRRMTSAQSQLLNTI